VSKCDRQLEQIERDFRKLLGAVRVKPLGRDRFYNRVWWFDGMGAASLLGTGGSVQYGAGRIFLQGPSEFDVEVLDRRGQEAVDKRREEEGEDGMLGVGEWAVFDDIETVGSTAPSSSHVLKISLQMDEYVAWLNPKGVRELALKNILAKWWPHIGPGMRRRTAVGVFFSWYLACHLQLTMALDRTSLRGRSRLRLDGVLARSTLALSSFGSHTCSGQTGRQ
jgi:bromodomain adjacent to zinc finger domain protein 1A